jgi:hypothetical protein
LKNFNLENNTIKNISIFLEMKARNGDVQMGEKYKNYISSIFSKIKVKLYLN